MTSKSYRAAEEIIRDGYIRSTKQLRTYKKMLVCRRLGYTSKTHQNCHIVGLNLYKELFNLMVKRVRRTTVDEIVYTILELNNQSTNIRCCTIGANSEDKNIENQLLTAIKGKYIDRNFVVKLSPEARTMLNQFIQLLDTVQKKLGYKSVSISAMRDFLLEQL